MCNPRRSGKGNINVGFYELVCINWGNAELAEDGDEWRAAIGTGEAAAFTSLAICLA
jgi:hypothetical protein